MFPGMNKKAMEQAMKKLGVKQESIDASEVIIKTVSGKDLIIRNPQVMKVDMMGQESLQITGALEEVSAIVDADVKTVADTAHVSESIARQKLEECDGDLAKAILELQEK
ncbi:MAG: nascent polypeptide-associated complex protein [Nanoarchaeota archaeon]|nr:nascent polypeptide-associated complex protein [Nanoarchaeota archaeon]